MKRLDRFLLAVLVLSLCNWSASPQGPESWHDGGGSYLTMFHETLLESDGTFSVFGIAEEDYEGFGHFVSANVTVSGGGNSRYVVGTDHAKFYVEAEASFILTPGDTGTYTQSIDYSWTCPYLNNGFTEDDDSWFTVESDGPFFTGLKNPTPSLLVVNTCIYSSYACWPGTSPTCTGLPRPIYWADVLPCPQYQACEEMRFTIRAFNITVLEEQCVGGCDPVAGPVPCS